MPAPDLLGEVPGLGKPGALGLYGFPVYGLEGEVPGCLVGDLVGDLNF